MAPRPNPLNPRVEIAFTLEKAQAVELTIFDVRGRLVATLLHEERPAGVHSVVWVPAAHVPTERVAGHGHHGRGDH